MDFFGLLTMIGGLELFLYGMKMMGDALSRMADGRLEQVLERMTDHPVKAVLLEAGRSKELGGTGIGPCDCKAYL